MQLKKEMDFYGHRKIYYIVSLCLIALAIVYAVVFGVKVDIQFTGGTIATYSYDGELDFSQVEAAAREVTGMPVTSDASASISSEKKQISLNFGTKDGLPVEMESALTDRLTQSFGEYNMELVTISSVSATMGRDFLVKCLVAVLASFVLMVIYVAIRFRRIGGWTAGVTGVIALLHDAMMILATFIIFRLPIGDNFMAVILFILGYSINDTIVIFDRIRENEKLYGKSMPLPALVNKSINQTFVRTMNTTLSTLIAMGAVCVFALAFHVSSILTFAFPMVIGLFSGFYSSVCLSGTIWTWWQESMNGKKKKAKSQ